MEYWLKNSERRHEALALIEKYDEYYEEPLIRRMLKDRLLHSFTVTEYNEKELSELLNYFNDFMGDADKKKRSQYKTLQEQINYCIEQSFDCY